MVTDCSGSIDRWNDRDLFCDISVLLSYYLKQVCRKNTVHGFFETLEWLNKMRYINLVISYSI